MSELAKTTQQRKRHSALEAVLNVLIGFGISTLANAAILPMYGMPFSWNSNIQIGLWFTAISVIRSYGVRRMFVRLHDKGIL